MNRLRVTASSRDAAIRASYKKLQESLIAPETAAEEHAAELAQGPEAAIGDDPLGVMEHTPETVEDFEGQTEE
jgi:DNA-directed RNA polymerase subunit beta'